MNDPRAEPRHRFVRQHCDADPATLERAGEDAGMRSYWRLPGAGLMLMDAPPADNDLAAWLDIRTLLDAGGVRVPRVAASDTAAGFVLMEDLGHKTLLQSIDDDNADAWFDAAIDQLLKLQAINPPADLPRYDTDLLDRELAYFDTWFIPHVLGIELGGEDQATWRAACRFLVAEARSQAQVLVHRDYMPRNLMPVSQELAVIDFQDAVVGPITYDVLSLFKDAFRSWPEPRVETWLRRYHDRGCAAGLPLPPWPQFKRDADLIGVHRHLKVIGIFARLQHRDGKSRYLPDVPRFFAYLETVLPRHAELAPLNELLTRRILPAWHTRPAA